MVKKKIHHNLFITSVGVQNNFCVSHPIRIKCKMYSYIAKSHIYTCTGKKQRENSTNTTCCVKDEDPAPVEI